MKHTIALFSFALVFAACDDSASSDGALSHGDPVAVALPNVSVRLPSGADLSVDERNAQLDDMMAAHGVVAEAVRGAASAQAADRRLKEALASLEGTQRSAGEQIAAVTMLEQFLSGGQLTDSDAALATAYARQLVKHESSEAGVITRALERIGDRLPAAERVEIAQAALSSVQRSEEPECVDCDPVPLEIQALVSNEEGPNQAIQDLERVVASGGTVAE